MCVAPVNSRLADNVPVYVATQGVLDLQLAFRCTGAFLPLAAGLKCHPQMTYLQRVASAGRFSSLPASQWLPCEEAFVQRVM
jgi:hypothetical protein